MHKNQTNKRLKFLLLGRITKWKGQELFINLAIRKPEYDFLIGGLPNNNDHAWFNNIKKKSPSNIKWLGFVDPYDIIPKIDVLVVCSLGPEPFGRTIIEALAMGKKIIAPNEGGPADILKEYGDLYNIEDNFAPEITYKKNKKIDKELSKRVNRRTQSLLVAVDNFVNNGFIKTPKKEELEKYSIEIVARQTWDIITG